MNAIDVLLNISSTKLILVDKFRYCLVGSDKVPYTINGTNAKPNTFSDFVSLEDIANAENLDKYAGVGISIQASGVCAIDIDHCFKIPFDFNSGDERALYVYNNFKELAYIEFSFSGTGMRVLFFQDPIENYNEKYYIKNSINNIEYYQPSGSARYVTVTGKAICDNDITQKIDFRNVLIDFLDKYMERPRVVIKEPKKIIEAKDKEQAMKRIRGFLWRDVNFQQLWLDREEWAFVRNYPGIGESEHDAALIGFLYENISHDRQMVKELFEESPYFKTKDAKHMIKWNRMNFRYFNFVFDNICGKN